MSDPIRIPPALASDNHQTLDAYPEASLPPHRRCEFSYGHWPLMLDGPPPEPHMEASDLRATLFAEPPNILMVPPAPSGYRLNDYDSGNWSWISGDGKPLDLNS